MLEQDKVIWKYEALVCKLEGQINDCQKALDDSTNREVEQLEMIEEMKELVILSSLQKKCQTCVTLDGQNNALRTQNECQQSLIDKLNENQELLMKKYMLLETQLDTQLSEISQCNQGITEIKASDD